MKEDMEKEIELNGKRKWRLENVNTTRYLMTSPDLEINFKLTFFRLAGAWNQKTKHIYIRTRITSRLNPKIMPESQQLIKIFFLITHGLAKNCEPGH